MMNNGGFGVATHMVRVECGASTSALAMYAGTSRTAMSARYVHSNDKGAFPNCCTWLLFKPNIYHHCNFHLTQSESEPILLTLFYEAKGINWRHELSSALPTGASLYA